MSRRESPLVGCSLVANKKKQELSGLSKFKETLSYMLATTLFVYIAKVILDNPVNDSEIEGFILEDVLKEWDSLGLDRDSSQQFLTSFLNLWKISQYYLRKISVHCHFGENSLESYVFQYNMSDMELRVFSKLREIEPIDKFIRHNILPQDDVNKNIGIIDESTIFKFLDTLNRHPDKDKLCRLLLSFSFGLVVESGKMLFQSIREAIDLGELASVEYLYDEVKSVYSSTFKFENRPGLTLKFSEFGKDALSLDDILKEMGKSLLGLQHIALNQSSAP